MNWVLLKLKPLWNWVKIEDDIFVHHLHLFPCITGIYKLSVRLIVIPCLKKSCIFHKHPNSDICIFVPIQIPITVIKAASDNSIFKTFIQQQEYAFEVSVNYQMYLVAVLWMNMWWLPLFHTIQYVSFFVHSHYDEVSVLLAVGITAVSMNLITSVYSTVNSLSKFKLSFRKGLFIYLGDDCKYSMSKGVKYEK